ncbi:type II secretion system protein GspC [Vibrio sp. D404a]|uniref:type II secretion system protein GspC n=1 Tax=unclassified Vibrio TaxID=2614977 RepID=UPI002554C8FD|nr:MULTISPECIES: type II secretion system protein GspC [unclassified Vibrio]MDK9737808.1 type II secretion system protein GspC [Vibrio sp. D404a]MDK9795410.1 type II secretion system protein GspC [Vibrio sp. D449a]
MGNSPLLSRLIENGFVFQQKLSLITCCVLIAISAWILGQLAWLIEPAEQSITSWKAQASSSSRPQSTLDISSLQKSHLFGEYNAETPQVIEQPVIQDAPKTRLNLVLVGAVASSDPNRSLAVIANRGKQATYGISEEIEGTRAKLKAVLIDRVIIDNSGRDETLMLEGLEYKRLSVSAPAKPRASASVRGNNPGSAEEKLEDIKAKITQDPQQIFQYVRLSQVKRDGNVIGYRVSPGKDPELFKSVGLQSGDIATQLNGQDLTDPAAMGTIFRSISDLTELNLVVERDGQQHDIFIEF